MAQTQPTETPAAPPDVRVQNEGNILLFALNTQAAQDWVTEHVTDPLYFLNALVVDQHYAGELAHGMRNDGLTFAMAD